MADEWTTIGVRKSVRKMLEEVRQEIQDELGVTLSLEDTISYLINFYRRVKGKEEAPLIA